jgi:SUMO ligase MMS21 Smc5/6 complex component
MNNRVYYDVFMKQKTYKKLKIFDEILTKEENHFYNFNFTDFYNKIISCLKIIKDEKINLASVIITEETIGIPDL